MWQDQPKQNFLPIERTKYGFIQKSSYQQPDLYHEEVIEIDSPFVEIVASGTQVYTFLLAGDQNAGKSTFLHSFTYHPDAHFTHLSSILPILSSTFCNSRFVSTPSLPCDEPPFLDTDLARGTLLLTRDDFVFWLDECGLCLEELGDDVRFVLLQFVEIGGDHLDLMMRRAPLGVGLGVMEVEGGSEGFEEMLGHTVMQSVRLLQKAKKTIYFVNMSTLLLSTSIPPSQAPNPNPNEEVFCGGLANRSFPESSQFFTFQKNQLKQLMGRLEYLNSTVLSPNDPNSTYHEVLLYLSRFPDLLHHNYYLVVQEDDCRLFSLEHTQAFVIPLAEIDKLMHKLLNGFTEKRNWKVKIGEVVISNHLYSDGTLNADAILATLARLFRKKFIHEISTSEQFVLKHLTIFFKEIASQQHQHGKRGKIGYFEEEGPLKMEGLIEEGDLQQIGTFFWLSVEDLYGYLEEEHTLEVTQSYFIQNVERICRILNRHNLCLVRKRGQFEDIRIRFEVNDGLGNIQLAEWDPTEEVQSNTFQFRFPVFTEMFKVLDNYIFPHLPSSIWNDPSDVDPYQFIANLKHHLNQLQGKMDYFIAGKLEVLLGREEVVLEQWLVLFHVLEEWLLLQKLVHSLQTSHFVFPQQFHITTNKYQSLTQSLKLQILSGTSLQQPNLTLNISLGQFQ